ncbi:myomegalin-like [Enhydra lutris kenyoni]|uniref:Myomegalin-like n=1 Tax=Enhydra lutris kenyoni TaxID=391180 RepID=A0A2Y9L940_ENHLU|nr:myomegalin-like [Enhydra lutris kenyoni]
MQRPLEKGPAERRVDGQQTQPEEAGSSSVSHSGKYHSLIQDQARELTHLRQKMRMGRAFSSLLIQHVRNTVKTFEELLSSNKVDRYMEQHFREQLTKGSLLAESLASKFSTDDCTSEKNQARQMLRTLRMFVAKALGHCCSPLLPTLHFQTKMNCLASPPKEQSP